VGLPPACWSFLAAGIESGNPVVGVPHATPPATARGKCVECAPVNETPTIESPPLPPWRKLAWIGVLSFASGMPFGIFKDLIPVWLRSEGVAIETIGSVAALALPWSLKVFWAPLVDHFGGRRVWIAGCLLVLTATMMGFSVTPTTAGLAVGVLSTLLTFGSATQDIAVDAYTIGILDRGEEGPANAVRVAAYRAALLVAGGAAVALVAPFGWMVAFLALGMLFATLALATLWVPPVDSSPERRRESLWRGLLAWLRQPGAVTLALVILVYRWPDAALGPMVRTFWVDAGLSLAEIGALAIPITMGATVLGAALGGWYVGRVGILRGLFCLGLAASLSNLAYAAAALEGGSREWVLAAAAVENICGGLGTAAFLSLLMRVCEKERAAVEYALVSALFASTRDLTGAVSGFGVAWVGYAGWFGVTSLLAIPGLALLFSPKIALRVGETPLGHAIMGRWFGSRS